MIDTTLPLDTVQLTDAVRLIDSVQLTDAVRLIDTALTEPTSEVRA